MGCLSVTAKFGPLARSKKCAVMSGLDDKLMTHFLSKIEGAAGLLVVVLEAVVVVLDVVPFIVVAIAELSLVEVLLSG